MQPKLVGLPPINKSLIFLQFVDTGHVWKPEKIVSFKVEKYVYSQHLIDVFWSLKQNWFRKLVFWGQIDIKMKLSQNSGFGNIDEKSSVIKFTNKWTCTIAFIINT